MAIPTCKYDPDCVSTPNCSMAYTTTNGSSPSTHATFSISGTTMYVDARNVNLSSVTSSYWTVTKQIMVDMTENESRPTYHNVNILVLPCELTTTSITALSTPIGSRMERTFSAHSLAHGENTTTICGSPVYELVGGDTEYLTFTVSRLHFVFFPRTTAYQNAYTHTIRSWCSNFPLNYKDTNFSVTGTAPESLSAYVEDRKSIAVMPALEKYDIGADGNMDLPFALNYSPSSRNYYKIYTWTATNKIGGASVSVPFLSLVSTTE
jgi:hypothetical protein